MEDVIFLRYDHKLQRVFGGLDPVDDLTVGHPNHRLAIDIDQTIACGKTRAMQTTDSSKTFALLITCPQTGEVGGSLRLHIFDKDSVHGLLEIGNLIAQS